MNGSHWAVLALGLLLGSAIPRLLRWSSMPLVITSLAILLGLAVVVAWKART